ncbi:MULTISPECIES: class I SAM-dependent methyltransferase [unclassified Synechocystis]|uniref:class I SAM-dependent methyltransferase n=1 Tax=unclassified Synechocystis TaxID=2640012 RepID=UPI0004268825|nr:MULTISPECIES: class I SAM-dependent methyltransferase [unclassified Synechocystis]AIE74084.1 hypothetical protein D082_15560 [Synechocystis sp. PCC 6714]MCT0252729.1 class I SAM-dependent methyltransferase [Synechocystis sp. CS-94]
MLERILEPEVMDTEAEALDYDAMDFRAVNLAFAERACQLGPTRGTVLDAGTGTARIPILLAQLRPGWQITAIDFARSMLAIARENVIDAGCEAQICLEFVDAKRLPYANGSFDGVIANSLCHHLPRPLDFLREVKRVLKPHGFLLIRDLIRPESQARLAELVTAIGSDYNDRQRKLFADSLHASLTIAEVQDYLEQLGWGGDNGSNFAPRLYQSSDRHWTVEKAFQN